MKKYPIGDLIVAALFIASVVAVVAVGDFIINLLNF